MLHEVCSIVQRQNTRAFQVLCRDQLQKDTYEIVKNAWAGPMNGGIEKMIGVGNVATGTGYNGCVIIDKNDSSIFYGCLHSVIS